jgi:hypothetical protein
MTFAYRIEWTSKMGAVGIECDYGFESAKEAEAAARGRIRHERDNDGLHANDTADWYVYEDGFSTAC